MGCKSCITSLNQIGSFKKLIIYYKTTGFSPLQYSNRNNMSFYLGPNTPMSYTGKIIYLMCKNSISVDKAVDLFCRDTPGAFPVKSLRDQFQLMYDNHECKCSAITKSGNQCKRMVTNKNIYCKQHIQK